MIKLRFGDLLMRKIISLLMITAILLTAFTGCKPKEPEYPENVATELKEGVDYIDHTSTYDGKTIVSVKITYESNKTGVLLNGEAQIDTDAVIEVNANSITLGVGNTDASVTNGQVRITAIEVVYN